MKSYVLNISDAGVPSVGIEIIMAPPVPPPVVVVPLPIPAPPVPVKRLMPFHGMNLAGGGAQSPWSTWGPGGPVSGTDYQFVSHAEVDALVATGANIFRVLFSWESLQRAPWDSVTLQTNSYAMTLHSLITYITAKGCTVLLDIHGGGDAGFAAYYDVPVGAAYNGLQVSDLLENVWWQLATMYAGNKRVWYGITNEPHNLDAKVWFSAAQNVVNGIRKAGATSRIYVPGVDWTGADTWMNNNSTAYNITDPLNNTGVQLHMYMDASSGGGGTDVVSPTIGSERCKAATVWARSKGVKLFLAEVGLSATAANGKAAWDDLMTFMLANSDVWDGFTFWAAGPPSWWSGYQFYCGPGSAQLAMIAGNLK